jgi:hypothetical protein
MRHQWDTVRITVICQPPLPRPTRETTLRSGHESFRPVVIRFGRGALSRRAWGDWREVVRSLPVGLYVPLTFLLLA